MTFFENIKVLIEKFEAKYPVPNPPYFPWVNHGTMHPLRPDPEYNMSKIFVLSKIINSKIHCQIV